jgi:hypothetical protein
MDSIQNGLNTEVNPEGTQLQRNPTMKGLNPKGTPTPIGLSPDWDLTRNGLNPKRAQSRLGLNPDWDSTPTETQPQQELHHDSL